MCFSSGQQSGDWKTGLSSNADVSANMLPGRGKKKKVAVGV